MATKNKSAASAAVEPKFTKANLVNAKRFRDKCDLVVAVLEDGVEYTFSEAEELIANYLKGKVK